MSEKPKEEIEKVKVTVIMPSTSKSCEVEVNSNSKVSDLVKKVAKAFVNDGANKSFNSFQLTCQGRSLALYYDKLIKDLAPSSNNFFIWIFNDDRNSFNWNGELIKEKESEKKIVELNEKESLYSNSDDEKEKEGGDEKESEKKEEKEIVEQSGKESSWPWTRITLGVMDLGLLATAIISFILGLHIAISIVLIVLFVLLTTGVVGWKKLLSKCLQEVINLKTCFRKKNKNEQENQKTEEKPEEEKEDSLLGKSFD